MLSTLARRPLVLALPSSSVVGRQTTRLLATESLPSSSSDIPPPPRPSSTSQQQQNSQSPPTTGSSGKSATRTRLYPQPRPAVSHQHPQAHSPSSLNQTPSTPDSALHLPPRFGRNQLLPVSDSTRALLESIVEQFDAPIRYAFAYGSGVFDQDGYGATTTNAGKEKPMVDFIFAVSHPSHWHSINMMQHPGHYTFHSRVLGSEYVSRVQGISPGLWFNTLVPMQGVTIKYGVTTVDNLCADLLNWRTLYLAGRMHKPLRIIKDDARVRLTQQVNLTSAIRTALLTLPSHFSETDLFSAIAGMSYAGDPRMLLPAENRGKVGNIVRKQAPQFKELYHRLVTGLPGVHWSIHSDRIEQDGSAGSRAMHLRKLPENLLRGVRARYGGLEPKLNQDESAYWVRMAGSEDLPEVLGQELVKIVRYPATIQSLKGITSAGIGKSLRYSSAKVVKWWKGAGGGEKKA